MKGTFLEILNYFQLFYIILASVILSVSFIGDPYFFKISIVSCLIKKIADICCEIYYHRKKFNKEAILDITLSILGFKKFRNEFSAEKGALMLATFIFFCYQDLILWINIFSNHQKVDNIQLRDTATAPITNNNDSLIANNNEDLYVQVQYFYYSYQLQIIQLVFGLLMKGICVLFIQISVDPDQLQKENIQQLLSTFCWIISLQGLFFFLFFSYYEVLWIIISIKVINVLTHSIITFIFKLDFFGCLSKQIASTAFVGGMVELLNVPIDYAPFYCKKWNGDFKQVHISTQKSIHIFKLLQTIQLAVNIVLNIILLINLRQEQINLNLIINTEQEIIASFKVNLLLFFLTCGITSLIITVNHLIKVFLTHNYRFLKKNTLFLEQVIQILEKSDSLTYFEVQSIQNKQDLEINFQHQKYLLQNLIKHLPKSKECSPLIKIDDFVEISSFPNSCIKISKGNLLGREFQNLLSDFHCPIPRCIIVYPEEIFYFPINKSIITRMFQEGITSEMKEIISLNNKYGHASGMINGQKALSKFEAEILKTIAFSKYIFPFLLTNPTQVLHDLQFNEKKQLN